MRVDRKAVQAAMPPFGSRLAQAMSYRGIDNGELTARLRRFGLDMAPTAVYRLTAVTVPPNPTLITIAALRDALQIDAEWWFDLQLTATDLPRLDLIRRKKQ